MLPKDPSLNQFYKLTPNLVLDSLQKKGFMPTGRVIQLNSYENRVFDIELEDQSHLIAKFYRPYRWSREAIQDEHDFISELEAAGINTAIPIRFEGGSSILEIKGIFWAIFPKIYGRSLLELNPFDLKRMGRLLAIIHNVGSQREAKNRITLSSQTMGYPSLEVIENFIYPEVANRYFLAAEEILEILDERLEGFHILRIHGDCHRGNFLDSGSELYLVDFDDFCNGPAIQDLWMLILGSPDESQILLESFMRGYEELRSFNFQEMKILELLRGLRLIHYSAWIAKRWKDPTFPNLFPHFGTFNYWSEECETLEKIVWNL